MKAKTLLSRKELTEATNGKLSLWTIGELTRQRKIPHIRIGARLYLYDLDKINKWLEKISVE
jgi:hypothetical protein